MTKEGLFKIQTSLVDKRNAGCKSDNEDKSVQIHPETEDDI